MRSTSPALAPSSTASRKTRASALYQGYSKLEWYITEGRTIEKAKKGGAAALAKTPDELAAFKEKYRKPPFTPAKFETGQVVEGYIGIDGGSTSTKAVLVDKNRNILCKTYQLSKGNPIEDTQDVLAKIAKQVTDQGATLKVLGVGTTGYAKDILKDAVGADVALVETVAHTQAALHFYPDVDVICDVGGQDIKIIILKNGRVKDFKLNTQCSAGNGYFLQGTCEAFGFKVEEFADIAFNAKGYPQFGYGCAVFMQSDIVDFQRQGWKPEEIMAGLCNVLPKNIWLYVSQIPNLSAIGRQVRPAGRHAAQPGGGEVAGGLHRVALQGQGRAGRGHRPQALRRGRRHRLRLRSRAPVGERQDHRVHRARQRGLDQLHHHPQRGHALLLLQEQVPAHLH